MTLGREAADVTIADNEISKRHAVFRPVGEGVQVEDLGSTNGTFVNGERISARPLDVGDTIRLGGTTLRLSFGEGAAVAPATPSPSPDAADEEERRGTRMVIPAMAEPSAESAAAAPRPAPPEAARSISAGAMRSASVVRAGLPATMKGRVFPSIGLLLVQVVLGYEWLVSGLTKIVRGGFASGLEEELVDELPEAPSWYADFEDDFVIPNAELVGWLTIIAEVAIGLALIVAALLWMFRWERLPRPARSAILLATVISCIIGIFLNIQFYVASDDRIPFFIAEEAFDEGIGLDVLMPFLQLIVGGVAWWTWLSLRAAARSPAPATA